MDEAYRVLSFERKLGRVAQLNALVRDVALARIRAQHPEESARDHQIRFLLLTTPRQIVERLVGPLPQSM